MNQSSSDPSYSDPVHYDPFYSDPSYTDPAYNDMVFYWPDYSDSVKVTFIREWDSSMDVCIKDHILSQG